jgi:hypothetical protein
MKTPNQSLQRNAGDRPFLRIGIVLRVADLKRSAKT